MKNISLIKLGFVLISSSIVFTGCGRSEEQMPSQENTVTMHETEQNDESADTYAGATRIVLSDTGITVDGKEVSTEATAAVYTANDIIYYEEGQDFTYGAGSEEDAHSAKEASEHTVVHIAQPGNYHISGTLSAGQIAVDLGEEATENPEAVVTLILDNADVTCSVAPAVIFYNVYECGSTDAEQASETVDTSAAGANVIIADGSVNHISGSYVAKIYESVELNDDGTELTDSKKLHKYDGAFYSKMSMNMDGGTRGTGILNIIAENEGLDSELHLTINGGNINITAGNDGINTNEDGISVTTMNGGNLNIVVDGATGEGDGIDSNGWIVINGGTVRASACGTSADSGIDSDMGIYINGGTVVASGNMLDEIAEGSTQNYLVLSFTSAQKGETTYTIKDDADLILTECTPANAFTYLVISDEALTEDTYAVWMGDIQLSGAAGEAMGGMPPMGELPEGMEKPENGGMPEGMEKPENGEMPEGMEKPENGGMPEGMEKPENGEMPEGMERPETGEMPEPPARMDGEAVEGLEASELTTEFTVQAGGNYYRFVSAPEA